MNTLNQPECMFIRRIIYPRRNNKLIFYEDFYDNQLNEIQWLNLNYLQLSHH